MTAGTNMESGGAHAGSPRESKKRVLIVDDNETYLDMLRFTLERYPFLIDTVTNAADAVNAIRKSKPDILLLDYMLAGSNGLAVLSGLPIGAISGTPVGIFSAIFGEEKLLMKVKDDFARLLATRNDLDCVQFLKKDPNFIEFKRTLLTFLQVG